MTKSKQQIFTDDGKFFFCECGAKVSVDAKACPSCGDRKAKVKANKRFAETRPIYIRMMPAIIIGLIVVGISKCVSSIPESDPNATRSCSGARENSVVHSVRYGVKYQLKDPDSFEFISARPVKSEEEKLRSYEIIYRAKNSFGAVVPGRAVVTVDKKCNPIITIFNE